MKRLTQVHVIAAAVIVCLSVPEARAQPEKVSIRLAPRPDQTVQMSMTQEMDFEISFGSAAPSAPPMNMAMRSMMSLTQKTGPRKADGSIDAEITYDEIRSELSLNGQPAAVPNPNGDLVGKPVVVTYNAGGEVIGVKGLPALPGLSDDSFRQMLVSFSGNLPATALGVGETAKAPLNVNLPLPLPGAVPVTITGETTLKLSSVDRDTRGRTAIFDSTVTGSMSTDVPAPDGKNQMKLNFTMTGDGTTIMDLDRGIPRSNLTATTFAGRAEIPAGAAAAAMPGMNMRGTIKLAMTSK